MLTGKINGNAAKELTKNECTGEPKNCHEAEVPCEAGRRQRPPGAPALEPKGAASLSLPTGRPVVSHSLRSGYNGSSVSPSEISEGNMPLGFLFQSSLHVTTALISP